MKLKPFKPNRAIDIPVRIAAVENYLSELHAMIRSLLKSESREVVRETVSEVIDTSTGGGTDSTDATSIHGEPIDETQPVDGDILTYDTATNEWVVRQWLDGRYGFRTGGAATASVHIGSSAGGIDPPPLKLTAGTETTNAEDGAWEYDGVRLGFTAQTTRRYTALSSDKKVTTTTVANTVTRTTVATGTIAANALDADQTFILTLLGRYSTANGADTFDLTAEFGNVDAVSFTSTAGAVTNAPVVVHFWGTVRSTGGAGTIWATLEADVNNASLTQHNTAVTVIDFGVTLNPTIDITWSAADPGNTFSCDNSILRILN